MSVGTGLVPTVSRQAHLTRVSPLPRPGTNPGIRPVIREPPVEGPGVRSRFPAAFRPPAFASRVILFPPGSWAFLTVGLPPCHSDGPCRGFHVPHSRDTTGLGAFSTPGTAVLILDRMPCPASACRFTTASPCTPLPLPTTEPLFTRHQRRFTRFTRPVCPSPVTPGWDGRSFGFPLGLRTLPLPATHAKGGARHRARARNYAADLMSALLTASPLAKCDLVSQRQMRAPVCCVGN